MTRTRKAAQTPPRACRVPGVTESRGDGAEPEPPSSWSFPSLTCQRAVRSTAAGQIQPTRGGAGREGEREPTPGLLYPVFPRIELFGSGRRNNRFAPAWEKIRSIRGKVPVSSPGRAVRRAPAARRTRTRSGLGSAAAHPSHIQEARPAAASRQPAGLGWAGPGRAEPGRVTGREGGGRSWRGRGRRRRGGSRGPRTIAPAPRSLPRAVVRARVRVSPSLSSCRLATGDGRSDGQLNAARPHTHTRVVSKPCKRPGPPGIRVMARHAGAAPARWSGQPARRAGAAPRASA